MMELFEANRLAFALALVIGLLVAWWIFRSGSKGAKRDRRPDVLDQGAAPAQRNQALIDAAPAAAVPTVVPLPAAGIIGGVAEIVAAAAQDEVNAASAGSLPISGDDLTRIKGLGPKLAALLGTLGVTSFAQIAGWSDADVARIDAQLGNFAGRPVRDAWVEQAKLLAAGDTGAFEGKFGKI
jgi:predicted flap endonuclease-1-like 5' DNA nuclease